MGNKNKLDSYINLVRKQTGETRSVREFVEFRRLIATPEVWAKIQEYRRIPSLWK